MPLPAAHPPTDVHFIVMVQVETAGGWADSKEPLQSWGRGWIWIPFTPW